MHLQELITWECHSAGLPENLEPTRGSYKLRWREEDDMCHLQKKVQDIGVCDEIQCIESIQMSHSLTCIVNNKNKQIHDDKGMGMIDVHGKEYRN